MIGVDLRWFKDHGLRHVPCGLREGYRSMGVGAGSVPSSLVEQEVADQVPAWLLLEELAKSGAS